MRSFKLSEIDIEFRFT